MQDEHMNLEYTDYSRKIDSVGRIGIPIEIRRKYKMDQGKEYQYCIITKDGKDYLALELGEQYQTKEDLRAELEKLKKQLENKG